MNKPEKMTYSAALEIALTADLPSEVKDKLTALKASIEKKNSADKKPTAQQTANAAIQTAILEALEADPDRMFTISEIIKAVPACAELTNQRVSALVRQLKEAGKVKRTEDKRKAYFSIA